MQKARCHPTNGAPTACKHPVSGLFHSGTPSAFHRSLTVLSPIGLLQCLALADGAACFRGSPSGSPLLRILNPQQTTITTGLSPPAVGLPRPFVFSSLLDVKSYNPSLAVTRLVWASTRSLATTDAITDCFLFLRLLRCFSSAGSPPHPKVGSRTFSTRGCPIRTPADQPVPAGPRSVSSLATSFFACRSQGIPRVPFCCVSI